MLRVTEINETARFFELKDQWNKVLEKSNNNNVFLTWEFLSTYWLHFGKGKKLRILVIEDKNEIIAIAPLRQSRYEFGKIFGYDVIEPLGYGGADYNHFILTDKAAECFGLFLKYLTAKGNWDFIYLFDLPEASKIPEFLSKDLSGGLKFELVQGKICPFISLPKSTDAFMYSLDNTFRRDLRRCLRNLERDCGKIELKKYCELGSVEDGLGVFFGLHQERWVSKLGKGVFNTQKIRDFYINMTKQWAENGWLALYFLTVKGEPIAAQYCIEYQEKIYYALSGFSMEYSKYSPGNVLTLKIIEDCIQRGVREFDFMKGDEPYKFCWTKQYRRNFGIRFVNSKFTSSLYSQSIKLLKQSRIDRILGNYLYF